MNVARLRTNPRSELDGTSSRSVVSSGWPLEMRILLECARTELDPARTEELRRLVRESPDWDRLLQLSDIHGLFPLLARHLNEKAADLVPNDQLRLHRHYFQRNAEHVMGLTADLIKILRLLDENAILAVPYKGPALAHRLYGSVALRQIGDLDILVARGDVLEAERVLEGMGFVPRHRLSPVAHEFILRRRYNDRLDREGRPMVELHWAFTTPALGFQLDLDQLRPRLGELHLGGARLPDFGTDDLLLILCAHGAKDCWRRLEWVSGVSELLRKEAISWPSVIERAAELQAQRMLSLGLLLAYELLDAPVPVHLVETARTQRDVMRLATIVRGRLASDDEWDPGAGKASLERDLFRLRLQPTMRDRLRYVFFRLTTPRRQSTRWMVSLRNHSFPLPALVRPLRAIRKLVRSLLGIRGSHNRAP